jgi:predicted solute-binding protein
VIRWPALSKLRIGCVQYLNARPLIYGYDGPVIFDHPSALARDLARGELDAALVPTFEVLRDPRYVLVDEVAIASDGPVFSVILAHRGPLEKVRTTALDPASLTSIHLLRVLLAEYRGLHPQYAAAQALDAKADAQLLIGNQAIEFRLEDAGRHELLDLGAEWKRCTGLPFVFAAWALRPGIANASEIAAEFRELKRTGLAALPDIVASEPPSRRKIAANYLTQHIRFEFRDREKAGIKKFRELLVKHDLLPPGGAALEYV